MNNNDNLKKLRNDKNHLKNVGAEKRRKAYKLYLLEEDPFDEDPFEEEPCEEDPFDEEPCEDDPCEPEAPLDPLAPLLDPRELEPRELDPLLPLAPLEDDPREPLEALDPLALLPLLPLALDPRELDPVRLPDDLREELIDEEDLEPLRLPLLLLRLPLAALLDALEAFEASTARLISSSSTIEEATGASWPKLRSLKIRIRGRPQRMVASVRSRATSSRCVSTSITLRPALWAATPSMP